MSTEQQPFSPISALHLFVSLLGEVEQASPDAPGAFYNRLAEAVCRLGSMPRAVVFVYDDVARRVRVVGSHKMHLVALHPLKPDPDIGLDVLHHVPDMERRVRVRQRGGDEETAGSHVDVVGAARCARDGWTARKPQILAYT